MKCKAKFINFLVVLVIGFVGFSLFMTGMREVGLQSELPQNSLEIFGISTISLTSNPLAYLFQILFILFIISPPLIVVMLFLIWKELKERNRLK